MKPKCIIFDEATAMLDPFRKEVMKTIKRLNKEEYNYITHNSLYGRSCRGR